MRERGRETERTGAKMSLKTASVPVGQLVPDGQYVDDLDWKTERPFCISTTRPLYSGSDGAKMVRVYGVTKLLFG